MKDFILVALLFGLIVIMPMAFLAYAQDANEPAIEMVNEIDSKCKGSALWECRACPRGDMKCICIYCVNESIGKTVEKDKDLRYVQCFPEST